MIMITSEWSFMTVNVNGLYFPVRKHKVFKNNKPNPCKVILIKDFSSLKTHRLKMTEEQQYPTTWKSTESSDHASMKQDRFKIEPQKTNPSCHNREVHWIVINQKFINSYKYIGIKHQITSYKNGKITNKQQRNNWRL